MKKDEIQNYLSQLNEELRVMNVKGEICLYGGAVMCLAYEFLLRSYLIND